MDVCDCVWPLLWSPAGGRPGEVRGQGSLGSSAGCCSSTGLWEGGQG